MYIAAFSSFKSNFITGVVSTKLLYRSDSHIQYSNKRQFFLYNAKVIKRTYSLVLSEATNLQLNSLIRLSGKKEKLITTGLLLNTSNILTLKRFLLILDEFIYSVKTVYLQS